MKMKPDTLEALNKLRDAVNARRRAEGMRPLTQSETVAELVSFINAQDLAYVGSVFLRGGR